MNARNRTPYYSSSLSSSDPDGQCVLDGVGYDPYQVLEEYFSIITDVDGIEASIVRLTRAMAIHPLLAAFSALTVAIAALPCYLPPVLSVATAWVTTVLAVVAVICNFALARKIKESSVPAYNFAVSDFSCLFPPPFTASFGTRSYWKGTFSGALSFRIQLPGFR